MFRASRKTTTTASDRITT